MEDTTSIDDASSHSSAMDDALSDEAGDAEDNNSPVSFLRASVADIAFYSPPLSMEDAHMLSARSGASAVYLPVFSDQSLQSADIGVMMLIGGTADGRVFNDVLSISVPADMEETAMRIILHDPISESLFPARTGHAACAVCLSSAADGRAGYAAFCFGGLANAADNTLLGDAYLLAPVIDASSGRYGTTVTTVQCATQPCARSYHAMVSLQHLDLVVLFGGFDGTSALSDVWLFDVTKCEWQCLSRASAIAARIGHAMAPVSDSQLILFGGMSDATRFSDLCVFDLDHKGWNAARVVGPLRPSARAGHSLTKVAEYSWILFGGDDGTQVLSDVWLLNFEPQTDSFVWTLIADTQLNSAVTSSKSLCSNAHAACYPRNGCLFFIGGDSGTEELSTVSILRVRKMVVNDDWTVAVIDATADLEHQELVATKTLELAEKQLELKQHEFEMVSIERNMRQALLDDAEAKLQQSRDVRLQEEERLAAVQQEHARNCKEMDAVQAEIARLRSLLR